MSAATAPRHDDRHLETFLGECVRESLDNHMVSNAVFLCERLHAASPGEHTTHLLATCYHRAKQPHRARAVLRGQTSERCRYLLALCCYDLGRLPEAERALAGAAGGRENVPPARASFRGETKAGAAGSDADCVPNGAAGFHLLGLVCKETGRRAAAVAHFATAMSLDPFMWSAREELCGLGAESEARDAEARFFGGGGDGGAHAGYPTLRELGGYLEARPGETPDERRPFGSAAPFGTATFSDLRNARSTAPRPFGTFRARPVVPDSAAPAAAADRAPPAETPGPARDLRLDEANATATTAEARNVGTDARDGDASGAGPSSAAARATFGTQHDLETPSPADPASAPPPVGKGRGGAAGFPRESELEAQPPAALAGEGSGPALPGSRAGAGAHRHGGRGARRVFVDEGKLRKVSGRLFADPATEEKFTSGVRRSSRLASIAGATPGPIGAAGDAETPAGSGFVTPAHPRGDEARETEAAAAPVRRGGRGARGAARGEYGRRESLDGEPSSRRSSEDGGAEFHEPTLGYPRGYLPEPNLGNPRGDAHNPAARVPNPIPLAPGRFAEGALALRALLAPLAAAAAHLSMFRGAECVSALSRLDPRQRDTGYALCLLGKAHAEMVAYPESARAFERARRVDPTRLESCEVYSTVLWHLKRDTRLSHLAQECVSCDRLAPQTWCALGNCFSLQKEHETALRFFRRALQLDPKHPYAHTLCGHEYFANEDFDKAMTSYRAAIRLDPRHYNAWYGLGTVYYRQEKYELSEYHFRHALGINSRSSVLFCYLGMAQHALRRTGDALELLRKAVALDAKNPLAKYEKASVLLSDDRFQEALEELEELKTVAPREASVFFLMGRIYKKLGLADQAMVNFSVALDLKPASSDVNLIKSAIEKLHVPDDSEDEDL